MMGQRARSVIPNLLSIFRLFLAPAFSYAVFSGYAVGAILLLAIAYLSDLIDGILARRWKVCSEFGSLVDPIADKVLVLTLFCVLHSLGWCPSWFLALLIASTLLQGMGLLLIRSRIAFEFRVSYPGKVNTASQYLFAGTCIGYVLFLGEKGVEPNPIVYATIYSLLAVSHVFVFLRYFSQTRQLIRWDWAWLTSTR